MAKDRHMTSARDSGSKIESVFYFDAYKCIQDYTPVIYCRMH
jgi:hypothetical protein